MSRARKLSNHRLTLPAGPLPSFGNVFFGVTGVTVTFSFVQLFNENRRLFNELYEIFNCCCILNFGYCAFCLKEMDDCFDFLNRWQLNSRISISFKKQITCFDHALAHFLLHFRKQVLKQRLLRTFLRSVQNSQKFQYFDQREGSLRGSSLQSFALWLHALLTVPFPFEIHFLMKTSTEWNLIASFNWIPFA